MHTLAEGVETEAQFEFLREIGCEKVQGYLSARRFHLRRRLPTAMDPRRGSRWSRSVSAATMRASARSTCFRTHRRRRGSPEIGDSLALAILEDCDGSFKYLYQNHMFRLFMKSIELDEGSVDTPHYERRLEQNRRMLARMMEEADRTEREVYTTSSHATPLTVFACVSSHAMRTTRAPSSSWRP